MLEELKLPTLQNRRKDLRFTLFYKIANGLVPAIPAEDYLTPIRNKRKIVAKTFKDCVTNNSIAKFQLKNSKCYKVPEAKTIGLSFFTKTISDWNQLPDEIASAQSLDIFKTRLQQQ